MSNRLSVKKLALIIMFCSMPILCFAQKEKTTEQFIVEVLSKKKNPFAYIPFNRALFLPTDEELQAVEDKASNKFQGKKQGPVVFISETDSTYQREGFLDSNGAPINPFVSPKNRRFSVKTDGAYFQRKQNLHLNRYPNTGRFLYYFSARDKN